MLNYFVDTYMWCFFSFFHHSVRNAESSYVNVNSNKDREQRKKTNSISLSLTVFYQQNKTATISCQAQNLSLPLLPSHWCSGISFVVSEDVILSHLLLGLSYVFPPESPTLTCQLFLILVHKSAAFLIFKCKGPIDQNFGKTVTWNV